MANFKISILTVTQLNVYVKAYLTENPKLQEVYVEGEISNFSRHYSSGHCYFSLKDATGAVRAVMFRGNAQHLPFEPENGMKVLVRGFVTLYERDGTYQLNVGEMQPVGIGALQVAYEQLKNKLYNEGLFDSQYKQPIAQMPRTIAVITSAGGAAFQDVCNVLQRRYPLVKVLLLPVSVQGALAVPEILQAFAAVEHMKEQVDTVILCRGGGSLEDLMAFNEESVVRAVYQCSVPVLTGIGHETDYTLCDFAADRRAPTPSAAAELAVPDLQELRRQLQQIYRSLRLSAYQRLEDYAVRIAMVKNSQVMQAPLHSLSKSRQYLEDLSRSLKKSGQDMLERSQRRLIQQTVLLDSLSPLKTLARGYTYTEKSDGTILHSVQEVQPGDLLSTALSDGTITAKVVEIHEEETAI